MNQKLVAQLQRSKAMGLKPNFSQLAREYGIDRRTIKKYYDGYEGKPRTRERMSRLDKYRPLIREKMAIRGISIRAVYEYLHDIDSTIGTYSNFAKYVKSENILPEKTPKGHPRYETLPGVQAQVDWKEDLTMISKHGEMFEFNILTYKLGYSRYCVFTYSRERTRQDVFDALIASFMHTGGIPQEILFDNMPSVVNTSGKYRQVNNAFRAFANDMRFGVKLCKARHAYTKGKVEAANKFMTWLLPYDHEFEDEEDLIRIIEHINQKVNQRPNQETSMPPNLMFQNEKDMLQNLPKQTVMEGYMSHDRYTAVRPDSLVLFNRCRYSVPPEYIGKRVTVRQIDAKVYIYCNHKMIAAHNVTGKKITYDEAHYRQLLSYSIKDDDSISEIAERNLSIFDDLL